MELDIERKVCFICGEGKADSVDHVPPKNLFLPKYRSMGENLTTVPAHRECNNGTSKDDEYFRFCVLTQAMWTSELAKELWDEKYKIRIHDPNKAGYKKGLLDSIVPSDFVLPSGECLEQIYMDAARIKCVVERIARGIYYKKTGFIMPLSWRLDIDWLDVGDKVKKVFSQSKKVVSFANGTFKYYWYEDSLTFHLLFFDVTYFRVKGRSSKMKSFHG